MDGYLMHPCLRTPARTAFFVDSSLLSRLRTNRQQTDVLNLSVGSMCMFTVFLEDKNGPVCIPVAIADI